MPSGEDLFQMVKMSVKDGQAPRSAPHAPPVLLVQNGIIDVGGGHLLTSQDPSVILA